MERLPYRCLLCKKYDERYFSNNWCEKYPFPGKNIPRETFFNDGECEDFECKEEDKEFYEEFYK